MGVVVVCENLARAGTRLGLLVGQRRYRESGVGHWGSVGCVDLDQTVMSFGQMEEVGA